MTPDIIESRYDIVIVGGGVTGAGVFHQAVNMGLKALLVEARDFAWGTSSRSSKMVHGGLRYLKEGKFLLTRSAVKERQRLLNVYPGLVTPLDFIMPIYKDLGPSKTTMKTGLNIYSLMAGERQHRNFDRKTTLGLLPGVRSDQLVSAVGFRDAQVDDARLVLRLIFDACDRGGHAMNYTGASGIERDNRGGVRSVLLKDAETGAEREVRTTAVINATGVFAETLHPSPMKGFHIRPLRGSHLIFPGDRYKLDRVISFIQPRDNRPIFIFPWEGCLVLGTTDVDFHGDLNADPGITFREINYLMEGLDSILPELDLNADDAVAAIAGVRPVLSRKRKSASKESREHVVWKDKGLVTVTGGKLTTFSLLARDALRAAAPWLPGKGRTTKNCLTPVSGPEAGLPGLPGLDEAACLRIQGRYGDRINELADHLTEEGRQPVESTHTLWAELCHGARSEQIRHLSDLLLRRVRIGLFLPNGGLSVMDRIREKVSPCVDWDRKRWEKEIQDYRQLWKRAYAPGEVTGDD